MSSFTRRVLLTQGLAVAGSMAATGLAWSRSGDGPSLNAASAGTIAIAGDLHVHRLGFGALRILGPNQHGYPQDPAEARRVLRRALELGVNLIDTADVYGPEVSERLIYDALSPYPKDLVIATKGGMVLRPGFLPGGANGSAEHLRFACEASLKRLHLERIDLYQLHIPDPDRPIEESITALKQLQQEGKIRHIGISNVTLDELKRSLAVAKIVSVQNRYSVLDRSSDDVLAFCESRGLAFLPWGPLSGPRAGDASAGSTVSNRLKAVAQRYGIGEQEAALAWLLARSKRMVPIPGTSNVDHLDEDIGAANFHLTKKDMAEVG